LPYQNSDLTDFWTGRFTIAWKGEEIRMTEEKYSYLEPPNEADIPEELQQEFNEAIKAQEEQQGFFNHLS